MIDVPPVVRNKAIAVGATAWLDDLPDVVDHVLGSWGLELGRVFPDATEAWVAEATRADGAAAVLKLIVPRDGDAARNEIAVLRLADGDGCAELLQADESLNALLVERLGPSMADLDLPLDQRLSSLAAAAKRMWRPAADAGFPTGAEKGRNLAAFITSTWESLDRPCSERTIEHALACIQHRVDAHDDERSVLVHGDVHQWNALRTLDGNGFKLVDPDGLLAEAEYDLGVLMREDPVELLLGKPFERAELLAGWTGLDATAIWEWGVAERVSTGLLGTQVGLQPVARDMLRAAEVIAADIDRH